MTPMTNLKDNIFSDYPRPEDPNLYRPAYSMYYPQRGEVTVYANEKQIYIGKWQPDFHDRLFALAYKKRKNISVRSVATDQLLFVIEPQWEVV